MTAAADRSEFVAGLNEDGESLFSSGRVNNIVDIVLALSIVLASLLAACLAALHLGDRWFVALVAGVPAAAATIQNRVGVRERADWYFLYAAEVRALATELKYASSPNLDEFGKRRARLETTMEAEWRKIARHSPKLSWATRRD